MAGRIDRMIPTFQQSGDSETEVGRDLLSQLQTLRDSLSQIFRKLQLD